MGKYDRGLTAYHGGAAAEEIVARTYGAAGYAVLKRRWRGQGGEIDLILGRNDVTIFVEVKKSVTFASAITQLRPRQIARLCASAEDYMGSHAHVGAVECRFDVALVNGAGQVEIIENAFA